jgi:OOP family OmpA-OmpF porin
MRASGFFGGSTNLKTILLAGAAIVALGSAAQAGELRGTYFTIEGGASWVGDERFFQQLVFTTGASSSSTVQSAFDTGWSVFASLGYAFDNNFRAEIEAGYRRNDIDRLLSSGGLTLTPDGELSEFTLMANILYDFYLTKRLSASIGAGAGVDFAQFDANVFSLEDDDWVFAYQALFGLNYALGERTQLFLNYRYLRADAPAYAVNLGGAPASTQFATFQGDLEKQAVTVGLRFALNGEAAPPPPAPPPPPPPPPAPKAPKEFIVFFGYDKANVTPEAQRVIEDAAFAAKEWGAASILIVGHTDSMGSSSYNQGLSLKRAGAVRHALEALGVPAGMIQATGKGESELLVQTGDAVKEPQNRRATINLQ